MRRLIILAAVILSTTAYAEENGRKSWSFYGNIGIGSQSMVSLEGLTMSAEDAAYFSARGIKPKFETEGTAKVVPSFKLGASYYFRIFRASLDLGSQYVNQSNYHATNFNMDALFGVSPLKGRHELNVDAGVGYYALWNNYWYNWKGLDENDQVIINPETGEPEQRSVYLGKHDTHCVSIPVKVSYLYNIAGRHWLGAYVQGRYNCVSGAFCPKFVGSGGIEYRFTLGGCRKKRTEPEQTCVPVQPMPVPVPVPAPAHQPEPCCRPCCPQIAPAPNFGKKTPRSYVYNPVYSPVYVIVTPDKDVKIETSADGGVKVETTTVCNPEGQNCSKTTAPEPKNGCGCGNGTVRILFEINSAVITETSDSILKNIDLEGVKEIEITASTCARGSDEANAKLGRMRLETVKKYLRGRGYTGKFTETQSFNETPDPDWRSVFIRTLGE